MMNGTKGRRISSLVALVLAILLLASAGVYAHMVSTAIKVSVEGTPATEQTFFDTHSLRTYLPAGDLARTLGGSATFDATTNTVVVNVGDNTIKAVIGEKKIVVNGLALPVDAGAKLKDGVPVLPIRHIIEALGGAVTWNDADKAVQIAGPVKVELLPPGHWHAYKEKKLTFKVTNLTTGAPVSGLEVAVRLTGQNGWTRASSVTGGTVTDNGDGSYTAAFTPMEMGSEYGHPYLVTAIVGYGGRTLTNAWAVEVVRDGPEGIVKEGSGRKHAYQVRYGWDAVTSTLTMITR